MLNTIEGTYRDGKIELSEVPKNVHDGASVIVTFLEPRFVDLQARVIDASQAAELRTQLATFAEDWDSPVMDIYNDYDTAKANL